MLKAAFRPRCVFRRLTEKFGSSGETISSVEFKSHSHHLHRRQQNSGRGQRRIQEFFVSEKKKKKNASEIGVAESGKGSTWWQTWRVWQRYQAGRVYPMSVAGTDTGSVRAAKYLCCHVLTENHLPILSRSSATMISSNFNVCTILDFCGYLLSRRCNISMAGVRGSSRE